MNTNSLPNIPRKEYRDFQKLHDKSFYAAYLNTAKQNVFIILKDLSDRMGLGMEDNDDHMFSADFWTKLRNNDEEYSPKIIDHLKSHFRFLKYTVKDYAQVRAKNDLEEPVPEDYYLILRKWIEQLLTYRNYYTHASHDPVCMDSHVMWDMKGLYYKDWQDLKKQKNLGEKDVLHLDGRDKMGKEKSGFQYAFQGKDGITEKGLLYFTCLWLERRHAQEFLKKHRGFKDSRETKMKATLEFFTNWSLIVPKPKVTSDHSEQGLFLDMLNDLQRCPKLLFDLLSPDHQKLFERSNEEHETEVEGYENKPLLIRKQSRFYYFALRYLDLSFKKLKFPIDLGNVCFKKYSQNFGTIEHDRRWIHKVIAYGNLTDFDKSKVPQEWKTNYASPIQQNEQQTYITETTPHYHFDATDDVMVVGMKQLKEDVPKIWPQLSFTKEGNLDRPRNDAPDFWLSLYELPGMVFYQWLHLQNKETVRSSAEEIIEINQRKMNGLLRNIASGKLKSGFSKDELENHLKGMGLEIEWLPKKIVRYLLDAEDTSMEQKAKNRLSKMIQENEEMLIRLKRKEKHYKQRSGSKDYLPMRSGEMADFLARDMIRLQPAVEQDQGKPNSTEFQVLQSRLAYFGKYKNELNSIFKLCNLVDSANPHPFLHKIDVTKSIGIFNFYQHYLRERKRFLVDCQSDQKPSQLHFLKINAVPDDIAVTIDRLLKSPMNLPRGLFKKPILNVLKKFEESRALGEELERMPRVNVAYIIQRYFQEVIGDEPQVFYGYSRSYPLLNRLYDKRRNKMKERIQPQFYWELTDLESNKNEIQNLLDAKIKEKISGVNRGEQVRVTKQWQKRYHQFTDNEKQIRLFKNCDQVQWMMVMDLYQKLEDNDQSKNAISLFHDQGFQLKEMKPDAEKGILNNIEKTSFRMLSANGTEKEIVGHVKIKNYGRFRALMKDRRVPGLLSYIDAYRIEEEVIRRELDEFERVRLVLLEKIHELEKQVISMYRLARNEFGFVPHEEILSQLNLEVQTKEKLNAIRNMVCHSQYPKQELFTDDVDGAFDEDKLIIPQISKWAVERYDAL